MKLNEIIVHVESDDDCEGFHEVLASQLAGSSDGMTLDEMVAFSEVTRRTVERRRDIVDGAFDPL
jgi:hypothetical protein